MLPFGWRTGALWTQKFPALIFLFAGCSLLLLLLPPALPLGEGEEMGRGAGVTSVCLGEILATQAALGDSNRNLRPVQGLAPQNRAFFSSL